MTGHGVAQGLRDLWRRQRVLLLALLAALTVSEIVHRTALLATVENVYGDLWHRISGVRFEPRHVVIVAVDDQSLARYSEDPLVFWTPHFARAVAVLRSVGASVVGIDFLFSITPENWIRKFDLPQTPGLQDFDLPFRQELNSGKTVLVGSVSRDVPGAQDALLLAHADYLLSLPNMDMVSHVGLADLVTDQDGGVRRFEIAPRVNLPKELAAGAPRLTLGALLALHASGLKAADDVWQLGGRSVRADNVGIISYAGPPGTVPRVPIAKVLAEEATNDPDVRALRGKVVIIGGEFRGMNDVHFTPYSSSLVGRSGNLMTGPEIQANIAETLLSGKATRPAPEWLRWLLLALLCGAAAGVCQKMSPWAGLGALGAGLVLVLVLAFALFQVFWQMPAAQLQAGLLAVYLTTFGARLTREERDKARIRSMFEGYVSDSVVHMLLSSDRRIDLGGQSMHITVLFSDIRNFTTITEKLTAHETVEFLNVYFERVIAVIREEGGRVDKFIGDAVMAEFGAPYPFEKHAMQALRAAGRMARVADEFRDWMRQRFDGRGIPEFAIGIGIHTGEAVVGNIGSAERMEFTAIGDTVNIASRLEGETKALNCVIVASADSVRAAGGQVVTGRRETLKVKGRAEPVEVYEILHVQEQGESHE